MDMFNLLKSRATTEDWVTGWQWLFWSFVGGLLPLWGTVIMRSWGHLDVSRLSLAGHGEFALYASSYLAAALFLVLRDFFKTTFPSRSLLSLVLIPLLLFSSFLFIGTTIDALYNANKLDPAFLVRHSTWLLIVSIAISFLVVVADSIRVTPDIKGMQKAQQRTLESDFEDL